MNKIKLESRDAIIEAAFQVLNEEPTASLGDIAARAGVGRATLHRYFAGRDDLMRALALIALEELEAAIERVAGGAQSYEEYFRLSIEAVVPLANRQWFLSHEAVDDDPDIAEAYAASRSEMHSDIEKAKEEGVFDTSLPTIWIEEVIENLTYAAWTMVRAGEATERQAAELAWRSVRHGLKGVTS